MVKRVGSVIISEVLNIRTRLLLFLNLVLSNIFSTFITTKILSGLRPTYENESLKSLTEKSDSAIYVL